MVKNCISGCERNFTLPMCRLCCQTLAAPYGSSMRQYTEAQTRYQRSTASPHGKRGTVRQKHQNKTWKFMRVRPVRMGYNWALLRLKQIAGEKRFEEAHIISMLREQRGLMKPKLYSERWDAEALNADGSKGRYVRV